MPCIFLYMNLTTPIRIRATFDSYSWPEECPDCGARDFLPFHGSKPNYCTSCHLSFEEGNPAEDPDERGGWVDPSNPWGSFEQDRDDDSCEPAAIYLPLVEAAEFLLEFPGAVWDYSEGEAEQNVRTGEWKSVTAHVDHDVAELVFAVMETI